jgi:uncharacterized protein (UPF0332 family)
MNLANDLLLQARRLAVQEPHRPKQASLRRAISTAYYALFHLLVQEAARAVVGQGRGASLIPLIGRVLDHAEMKKASSSFRYGAGSLPKTVLPYLPTGVPVDLTLVATAFFQLQEARHEADYNLAPRYSREEAEQVVALAETAFAAWKRVRATPEARVYLLSILFWSRWNR